MNKAQRSSQNREGAQLWDSPPFPERGGGIYIRVLEIHKAFTQASHLPRQPALRGGRSLPTHVAPPSSPPALLPRVPSHLAAQTVKRLKRGKGPSLTHITGRRCGWNVSYQHALFMKL